VRARPRYNRKLSGPGFPNEQKHKDDLGSQEDEFGTGAKPPSAPVKHREGRENPKAVGEE